MTEAGKGKNRSLALLGMITERNSGDQALRWTATGLLEEERKFRKVEGFRDLATLQRNLNPSLTQPSQVA